LITRHEIAVTQQFWLPFAHLGRRGWGMRATSWFVQEV